MKGKIKALLNRFRAKNYKSHFRSDNFLKKRFSAVKIGKDILLYFRTTENKKKYNILHDAFKNINISETERLLTGGKGVK